MAVDDVNNNKTMLKNYKLILDIKVIYKITRSKRPIDAKFDI